MINEVDDRFKAGRLILVDFDYTLFACNSTELFIASCKPAWLAALLDLLIRKCMPWRLLRVERSYRIRDSACVVSLLLLSPWNILLWRRKAPALYESHKSSYVLHLLDGCNFANIVIMSFGTRLIIEAMLRETSFRQCRLNAAPLFAPLKYFSKSKLDLAKETFSEACLQEASFISDSPDDEDLLRTVANGVLIEPQGKSFVASERLYVPLRYTSAVKYPFSYVFDQFVFVDCALLLLSTLHNVHQALFAALYAPLFVLSLMCIYEIGYFENDMHAARSEMKPTLSGREKTFVNYPIWPHAWLWSIAVGAMAIVATKAGGVIPANRTGEACIVWLTVLSMVRGTFYVYNRLSVAKRLVLYPILQIEKYLSVLLIVPPTIAGICLVLSQIGLMTYTYFQYRLGFRRSSGNRDLTRLVAFVILYTAVAVAFHELLLAPTPALFLIGAWLLARLAKPPLVKVLRAWKG